MCSKKTNIAPINVLWCPTNLLWYPQNIKQDKTGIWPSSVTLAVCFCCMFLHVKIPKVQIHNFSIIWLYHFYFWSYAQHKLWCQKILTRLILHPPPLLRWRQNKLKVIQKLWRSVSALLLRNVSRNKQLIFFGLFTIHRRPYANTCRYPCGWESLLKNLCNLHPYGWCFLKCPSHVTHQQNIL